MVVPPKPPKMIILVGKPVVVGYHHFRKPPYVRPHTKTPCKFLLTSYQKESKTLEVVLPWYPASTLIQMACDIWISGFQKSWNPHIISQTKSWHAFPPRLSQDYRSRYLSFLSCLLFVIKAGNNSNPSPPSNWQKKTFGQKFPPNKNLGKFRQKGEIFWELHTNKGCYIQRVVLCRTKTRRVRATAWTKSVKEVWRWCVRQKGEKPLPPTNSMQTYTNYHGPPKPSCLGLISPIFLGFPWVVGVQGYFSRHSLGFTKPPILKGGSTCVEKKTMPKSKFSGNLPNLREKNWQKL